MDSAAANGEVIISYDAKHTASDGATAELAFSIDQHAVSAAADATAADSDMANIITFDAGAVRVAVTDGAAATAAAVCDGQLGLIDEK